MGLIAGAGILWGHNPPYFLQLHAQFQGKPRKLDNGRSIALLFVTIMLAATRPMFPQCRTRMRPCALRCALPAEGFRAGVHDT